LVIVGLGVLADTFVPIYYGDEFRPAIEPLLLLLPGVLGFAFARPIIAVGEGIGSMKNLILATGSASVLNIALNLVLIPRFGMYGAAVSTSIGYGSMAILHTIGAMRAGYNPVQGIALSRISLVAALLFALLYVLEQFLSSAVLSLVIIPPIGAIIYVFLVARMKVVDPEDLRELANHIPIENNRINHLIQKIIL
jgi:O-antigen/teichoic acid export membrane protein